MEVMLNENRDTKQQQMLMDPDDGVTSGTRSVGMVTRWRRLYDEVGHIERYAIPPDTMGFLTVKVTYNDGHGENKMASASISVGLPDMPGMVVLSPSAPGVEDPVTATLTDADVPFDG